MFPDTIADDPTARQSPPGGPEPDEPPPRSRRVGLFLAVAVVLATVWVASS